MSTFSRIADLPLKIDGYELEGLSRDVSSQFTRLSTVVRLRGEGCEGAGEDVVYDSEDHVALQEAGPVLPVAGTYTFASFSEHLSELDLFPTPPVRDVSRNYRRWSFESAALDLALQQAGCSLADALGREPRPVNFVLSLRLGEPPSVDNLNRWLELYPNLRFKLDPTSSWDEALIEQLAASGTVDCLDFKGFYKGTQVDQDADPVLYQRCADAFEQAWLEDPELTAQTDEIMRPHRDRVTWDAPIHSVEDIKALPFAPETLNFKPSRFGPISALFEAYDYCAQEGIDLYGGGQFELSVGRCHIQYLASLFHPDTPNDVSPIGFHDPEPRAGLPVSPLAPAVAERGFRFTAG